MRVGLFGTDDDDLRVMLAGDEVVSCVALRTPEGRYVFRELNSFPMYLDVERKLGHPISRAIAELTLGRR